MLKTTREDAIVGPMDAQLLLANFRNTHPKNIKETDLAIMFLQGKTVREIKRQLAVVDDVLKRLLEYGTDYTTLQKQDNSLPQSLYSISLCFFFSPFFLFRVCALCSMSSHIIVRICVKQKNTPQTLLF